MLSDQGKSRLNLRLQKWWDGQGSNTSWASDACHWAHAPPILRTAIYSKWCPPILYTQELRHKEILLASEPLEILGRRDSEIHMLFAMDTTLQMAAGQGKGRTTSQVSACEDTGSRLSNLLFSQAGEKRTKGGDKRGFRISFHSPCELKN